MLLTFHPQLSGGVRRAGVRPRLARVARRVLAERLVDRQLARAVVAVTHLVVGTLQRHVVLEPLDARRRALIALDATLECKPETTTSRQRNAFSIFFFFFLFLFVSFCFFLLISCFYFYFFIFFYFLFYFFLFFLFIFIFAFSGLFSFLPDKYYYKTEEKQLI